MRFRSYWLCIVAFIVCLSTRKPSGDELFSPDKVISDIFLNFVGTEFYYAPHPIPPYAPIHPDSLSEEIEGPLEIEGFTTDEKTSQDSIYQAELTAFNQFDWKTYQKERKVWENHTPQLRKEAPIIHLFDSLISGDTRKLQPYLNYSKGLYQSNHGLSEQWFKLYQQLSDTDAVKIDFSTISKTGGYLIKPASSFDKKAKPKGTVGVLTFSNMVFNKEAKIGCFYASFICGDLCGTGYILYIELENGLWKIHTSHALWVT